MAFVSTRRPNVPAFQPPSPFDMVAVLASARSLQHAAAAGAPRPLLRGKMLGLLSDADGSDEAVLFRRAAGELGAHVALIRPSLSTASAPDEIRYTARMLGRLYDAVECEGLAPALVARLSADAGVPVYDALASAAHPTARLAELLGDAAAPADNRRFVLQAVLLTTIG
jgi:ornithine carbamoyltransferase